MTKQPQFPHDKGYKNLLSYKQIFLELLDSFVDQGWVAEIERKQIIRINKKFVYPEFQRDFGQCGTFWRICA
jgi:hypothetical protein